MPISAAQSDATAPDPRRKGRVELLAADLNEEGGEPIRQLTGDQPTATEDDISDLPGRDGESVPMAASQTRRASSR